MLNCNSFIKLKTFFQTFTHLTIGQVNLFIKLKFLFGGGGPWFTLNVNIVILNLSKKRLSTSLPKDSTVAVEKPSFKPPEMSGLCL